MEVCCFFFQAEDGIRDLVRSRGLGDVYKRQVEGGEAEGHDKGQSGVEDLAPTMRRPTEENDGDRPDGRQHQRSQMMGQNQTAPSQGMELSLIHI